MMRRTPLVLVSFATCVSLFWAMLTSPATQQDPDEVVFNTFSLAAFDPDAKEWGVIVSTAVPNVGAAVPWAKAGVGAVATQASTNKKFGPDGLKMLAEGKTIEEVAKALKDSDKGIESRQFGIVDAKGNSICFTGNKCSPWCGHLAGKNFACQGNLLAGAAVIHDMARTFEDTKGALAVRLMAALEAANRVGGDKRLTPKRSSALLVVRDETNGQGGPEDRIIDIRIDNDPEPVVKLAKALAEKLNNKKEVDEKALHALIADLGDESFEKREAASKALVAAGRPVLPLLRKTVADATDLEVRDRAANLVRTISSAPGPGVLLPEGGVRDLAISKDSQTLALGLDNKTVVVYDLKTMALRHTLRGHTNGVWSVAISPDGRTLASGAGEFALDQPHEIMLWDVAKGTALKTLKGDEGLAFNLAFSADGAALFSAGWDGTVRVWDPKSGKETGVLRGHENWVRRVHATPDGKFIVSCGVDGTVRVWNRESLKEERQMVAPHEGIGAAAMSPDGKSFITASRRFTPGIVTVWDLATGKEKKTINEPPPRVAGLAISPDGKLLAMSGGDTSESGDVKIYDLATGKVIVAFQDHKELVEAIAFSSDGNWLVTGSFNGNTGARVRIWDVKKSRTKGE
jgi:uncharacterized Ntn-hydrolase superfamily protein